MSEVIPVSLKRAAITLAEQMDHARAAEKLNITSTELKNQISALEGQLYVHIFRPVREKVELTEEGQFLIEAFRKSVALHDRNANKDVGETR